MNVSPAYDPADLVDAKGVAELLGLSAGGRAIPVYRSRYDDFPTPVIDLGPGRRFSGYSSILAGKQ